MVYATKMAEEKKLLSICINNEISKHTAAIHACSLPEKKSLEDLGLKSLIIVPNGVELRPLTLPASRKKTVLFLSRVREKKGIPVLLDAWKQISPDGWNLDIDGSGDPAYVDGLKK